ncbi:MAG: hypothetical protein ACLFVG_08485 [Candidatus Aminicenantes bacterium]
MQRVESDSLSLRKIFFFWVPLAATWLMMATEGPFLAAVIARLSDPKYNLAAYGVAYAVAVFIEAPIIMIMSASTALVKDRKSFYKLRNFTYFLNAVITLVMIILVIPPVFHFFAQKVITLPEDVAKLTHLACLVLLPWPSAIGYRRFYQGILIRSNLTRRVSYGTAVRLVSMASTAIICYVFFQLKGAVVGGLALSVGVMAEAVASKMMARASVKRLIAKTYDGSGSDVVGYRYIASFYYPLALTSILGLSVPPLVTFFMGHSRMAIESLAVLPVINSLVFIFRSMGLSYQEVGIALLGERNEHYKPLRNFALMLGVFAVSGLSLVAFTPLSILWFHKISGLSAELTRFSLFPTRIMALYPGLMVLLSFQRALMVNNRRTKSITKATAIEVLTIIILLLAAINLLDMVGATAAAAALVLGRMMANTYLFFPYSRILKNIPRSD